MKIVAHRGASGLAEDNSIKSLSLAVTCKVDVIEFDLQRTKDGVMVLHHDSTYYSKDNQRYKIKTTLSSDLKELPTLEDAVGFIHSKDKTIGFMLDCKSRGWSKKISDQINYFKTKAINPDQFTVISFSLSELIKFKARNSSVRTIYLWSYLPIIHILLATIFRQNGVGYPITADIIALPLRLLKRLNMQVYFYRVNTTQLAKRCSRLGIDYIGTDKPTIIVPAIKNIKLDVIINS